MYKQRIMGKGGEVHISEKAPISHEIASLTRWYINISSNSRLESYIQDHSHFQLHWLDPLMVQNVIEMTFSTSSRIAL